MNFIDTYIEGVNSKYHESEKKILESIESASEKEINFLASAYPNMPIELIELLKRINGSRSLPFFPTDSEDSIAYDFCSIERMLAHAQHDTSWINLYWDEDSEFDKEDILDDDELFAEEINPEALCKDWLLFADNGNSRLFIDFNPSDDGTMGQVVRYIHDPDMYDVVADNFSTYLQMIIDSDFEYLIEGE